MVLRTGKGSQSTMALSCSQAKIWVRTHYERHEDGVVAKSAMYKHYEDYCREQSRSIMETSIFGRVVKSVFPDVTIRRLGGRDNLKYYYCGIHAKESSPYAIDNSTTTRPKRRLRKRELVTDKTEVHNCLRWLQANFNASNESSVVKTEVYDAYISHCASRGVEPLSAQYFGMVVTHAFPKVTKRKLGPRTNQQKYYFGIQERSNPISLEAFPTESLPSVEEVLKSGTKNYREVENGNNTEEEEEEDYNCRSPGSDIATHGFHPAAYNDEIRSSPHIHYPFHFSSFPKEEQEPVDYSLSTLRLKDEPNEEDDIIIKEEPLDLHITRDISERRTPDRPPSAINFTNSSSPSPPSKDIRSKKIYKPRFHYDSSWNDDAAEEKRDESSVHLYEECQPALALRQWIYCNIDVCKGVHVNRDQLYSVYEKYCVNQAITSLPMTFFDETMLKGFEGVVTMIHPSGKTYYEGIKIKSSSPYFRQIQELYQDDSWAEDENSHHPMELCPEEESPSHSSPLMLDDDDDNGEEGYTFEQQIEEDMQTSNDIPRDGKFYLRKWLTDNFDAVPDSCVLKADAYRHYDIFARNIHQTPFEMNVFGKIVRQVFPDVSIRRLGGRLKPQYHYCGIAVKPTSPLCQVMSGKDPAQRSRKKEIATDNRSAEIVIDFLRRNFEARKEGATMKSDVFEAYSAYCNSINETPVTLNYFGKLVKHCFPSIEVRKFGGRSEPTWYYFGMNTKGGSIASYSRFPNSYSQISSSPSFHEESPMRDAVAAAFPDSVRISPALVDLRHPSTSPIPIAVNKISSRISSHSAGSPPALISARLVHNHIGSPGDTHYLRESISSPAPGEILATEIFYPRSPVEGATQSQLYTHGQGEAFHHHPRIHLAGGQVVPSQTPPNLLVMHPNSDHSMNLLSHVKKSRRPFGIHDDYEMLQEMGME